MLKCNIIYFVSIESSGFTADPKASITSLFMRTFSFFDKIGYFISDKKQEAATTKNTKNTARESPFTPSPKKYSASQEKIQPTQNFLLSQNKTLLDYGRARGRPIWFPWNRGDIDFFLKKNI